MTTLSVLSSLLPEDRTAINDLLEVTNPLSMFAIKKIHTNIRRVIEDTIPEVHMTKVKVVVYRRFFQMEISNVNHTIKLRYQIRKEGCLVTFGGHDRLWKGADMGITCQEDLELMLRHQQALLNELSFLSSYPDHDYYFEEMKTYLAGRREKLKVNNFTMEAVDPSLFLTILPEIHPDYLTVLNLSKFVGAIPLEETWDFTPVTELEQWKKAQEFYSRGVYMQVPIERITHFNTCLISVPEISAKELLLIRNAALQKARNFNFYQITFKKLPEENLILKAFGPWFHRQCDLDGGKLIWYFTTPGIRKIAQVTYLKSEFFYFERVDRAEVPVNLLTNV